MARVATSTPSSSTAVRWVKNGSRPSPAKIVGKPTDENYRVDNCSSVRFGE
jgi:hypothetical protein